MHKVEKKIGRPVSTGAAANPPRSVRLPPEVWRGIEDWRRLQPGNVPSRNEAICILLKQAIDQALKKAR